MQNQFDRILQLTFPFQGNVAIIYFREDKWDAEEHFLNGGTDYQLYETKLHSSNSAIWNNDEDLGRNLERMTKEISINNDKMDQIGLKFLELE